MIGAIKELRKVAAAFPPDTRIEGESYKRHVQALRICFGDPVKAREWMLAHPTRKETSDPRNRV